MSRSTTNYAGGGGAAARLLVLPRRATAALCFNDVVAIGLIRALTEAGVTVGRDFAVIGFDDIEEAKHMLPAADERFGERRKSGLSRGPASHAPDCEWRLRTRNHRLSDEPNYSLVLWNVSRCQGGDFVVTGIRCGLIGASAIAAEHMLEAFRANGGDAVTVLSL